MNERIKQLAIQVSGDYSKDDYWPFFTEELEKFTELIVRECADIAEAKEQGDVDYNWDMSVGWYIRQHFGVK
jgi:hypothetical protein